MHGNDIYGFTARSSASEQDPVSLSHLLAQVALEISTAEIRIRHGNNDLRNMYRAFLMLSVQIFKAQRSICRITKNNNLKLAY